MTQRQLSVHVTKTAEIHLPWMTCTKFKK